MNKTLKYIFGTLAALAMIGLCACSDDVSLDPQQSENGDNIVTISVMPEVQSAATRAGEIVGPADDLDPGFSLPIYPFNTLSQGDHIDVMLFAVYEVDFDSQGNETYTLAPEFKKADETVCNVSTGYGQNLLHVGKNAWPVNLKIQIDPAKTYRVAFWAQSSETAAYDASDLSLVKVDYFNAPNNDELRDAFCGVTEPFSVNSAKKCEVVLHRPLAQINVGTAGWDYEGTAVLRPSAVSYIQSEITLKGVAQFYDVIRDMAITSDVEGKSLLTDVTFNLNRLPAFYRIANSPEEIVDMGGLGYKPTSGEELLYVDYTGDGRFYPYVSWEDYLSYRDGHEEEFNNGYRPATEIFRYLSMCYVLVPEAHRLANTGEKEMYGAILDELRLTAYGMEVGVDINAPEGVYKNTGLGEILVLNNVPVRKNWRTNILSNQFFVLTSKYHLHVVSEYCGDYTNFGNEDESWLWGLTFGNTNTNNWSFSGGNSNNENFKKYWDNYYFGFEYDVK